uniref:Replication-associated protein n=1 Tax=Red panda feces-associated circular DNA virus 10 TaxID=2863963 RepID=A0A8K1M4F3_9VIRU|nr:replication-associated protein [Red panda feces-associated circular DNA virus 10]
MSRSRAWCFTINNPTDNDRKTCEEIECNYCIIGDEVGDKGTNHIQGYIEFANGKTMSSVKKALGARCHLEARKGTAEQAASYCKKDGKYKERGQISNQGKRNDLELVADLVKAGGIQAVVDERPDMFIKFGRNIERLSELLMKPRTDKPTVTWLWGKKGTGKTRTATEGAEYFIWTQTKWWNGYRQQKRIVIDDYSFDGSEASFRYLLRVLDRYAIQVETKGGMVWLNSPEIIVTCEFEPKHWFDVGCADWIRSENVLAQVMRRIDKVEELVEKPTHYDDDYLSDREDNITEDDELSL